MGQKKNFQVYLLREGAHISEKGICILERITKPASTFREEYSPLQAHFYRLIASITHPSWKTGTLLVTNSDRSRQDFITLPDSEVWSLTFSTGPHSVNGLAPGNSRASMLNPTKAKICRKSGWAPKCSHQVILNCSVSVIVGKLKKTYIHQLK